jgi:hypothetical protein
MYSERRNASFLHEIAAVSNSARHAGCFERLKAKRRGRAVRGMASRLLTPANQAFAASFSMAAILKMLPKIAAVLKAEFFVQGCRISAADLSTSKEELGEQLCLDLGRDYTVTATLVIRPVQGAIHIGSLPKIPKPA